VTSGINRIGFQDVIEEHSIFTSVHMSTGPCYRTCNRLRVQGEEAARCGRPSPGKHTGARCQVRLLTAVVRRFCSFLLVLVRFANRAACLVINSLRVMQRDAWAARNVSIA
jgi:hypothetical protein